MADGMREIWSIEQKAIDFFNKAFPADIAVFIFDNSGRHACKAKDTLVGNRMVPQPGRKQPVMHCTKGGDGIERSMVFLGGDKD
ncbi:hypothetical protein V8E54_007402 [Elaphomyces granulatus]